jgi:hypothetical protein
LERPSWMSLRPSRLSAGALSLPECPSCLSGSSFRAYRLEKAASSVIF